MIYYHFNIPTVGLFCCADTHMCTYTVKKQNFKKNFKGVARYNYHDLFARLTLRVNDANFRNKQIEVFASSPGSPEITN